VPPVTKADAEAFAKTYKTADGVILLIDDKAMQFAVDFVNGVVLPAAVQILVAQLQSIFQQMQSAKTIQLEEAK
jgi:hypothetical protein